MKNKIQVAGIGFNTFTYAELKSELSSILDGDKKHQVVKANSEFIYRAIKNAKFKSLMNESDFCIVDGIGIIWASKFLSLKSSKNTSVRFFQVITQYLYTSLALLFNPAYLKTLIPERLSGIEVFYTMLNVCAEKGEGVFFFGAKKDVLERAVTVIKKKVPKLIISGYRDGYGDKGEGIISEINSTDAKLLIVALGSPEQDYWIKDNLSKLKNIVIAVGEGGSFDVIGGSVKRAPKLIQRLSLEWLWRMFTVQNLTNNAPHRFKRAWNAVPGFMWEILKWKLKNG